MDRFDRRRQALAIGLAALAGYVDAIGFLSANNYFVSFMSGNTTRLGVDLAQDWHRAATPALLICGFVAGVAIGSVVAFRAGRWRKPAVLALVCTMLAGAALARTMSETAVPLGLLVLAMGVLNNTFQRDGQVAVGLTYMTGALVRLGQAIGAALIGERRVGWTGYGLLWLGLALGGVSGALVFTQLGTAALWPAAAASALFAAYAVRLVRDGG
jgi:uncharacterized membrane protein YoaK (UPF0700 family)